MRVSRNGLTQKQLAEKFNISVTTVIKYTAIEGRIRIKSEGKTLKSLHNAF